MIRQRHLNRRRVLGGLAGALAALHVAAAEARSAPAKPAAPKGPTPAAAPPAAKTGFLSAVDFGVVSDSLDDQSVAVQAAFDAAHARGRPLLLPAGQIFVQNLDFPSKARIIGQPGATVLVGRLDNPVGKAELANDLILDGIGFSAGIDGPPAGRGLLEITDSIGVSISNCQFVISSSSGLLLQNTAATIADCTFDQLDVGIFSHNSRGLTIRGNTVAACGNGGILVWRDDPGHDGSIVTGNRVSGVRAKDGGSGQNGNGINIYKADDVIVSDNVISDCDFSAVRANSTRNCLIRGNNCTNLREIAIYSEFAFSGSVIDGNVVDGAAGGISITNLDKGGTLAVCANNIVRNITAVSASNPDASAFGIYAEAETTITGNTVSAVPGPGILAGVGQFLKDVVIADNVVTGADTGIAVSVADGAGPVRIAGNMIAGAKMAAIAGMKWDDMASGNLVADASQFPNVSLEGNVVEP